LLERVANIDGAIPVPVGFDATGGLAGGERQPEPGDEPTVARPIRPDLSNLGRCRVLAQEGIVGELRPVRRPVEAPRPRLLYPRSDVDPGGVLDRLLRAGDVVVLEVPQRIKEAVPLPARGVGRRGVSCRRCFAVPPAAGASSAHTELAPTINRVAMAMAPSPL